jgi:serine/threonine protein kinase
MSEESNSLVGQTVGDYKIEKLLGEGGMGEVYAGQHAHLGHRAAVKVLRREIMNNREAVERFRQEARLIASVRHQNLIDIFDIGELSDGRLYYVMEYLSGKSLAEVLEKQRLSFREVMQIVRQVCAGLAAAHDAGIVHRDLKPENLFLVMREGEPPLVKLVDFGIAKTIGVEGESMKLTRTGTLVGTPFYMAPEQINGEKVDVRTDLYALGVILYQICVGVLPFDGENLGEVLVGHLQKPVPPLPETMSQWGTPKEIGPILAKLLAKSAEERYPTVKDVLADLERLQRGEQTTASLNSKLTLQALPKVTLPGSFRWVGLAMVPFLITALAIGGYFLLPRFRGNNQGQDLDMVSLRSLALAVLQEGLSDGDPSVRSQAVVALEDSRDSRHRSLLENRLRDADTQVQAQAARALGVIGNRGATAALLQRADEGGDPIVLVAVGESLTKLGVPAGKNLLVRSLSQEHYPQVQFQAALALFEAGDEKAAALISERLRVAKPNPLDEQRIEILARKAQTGDGEARTQLVRILPEGLPNQPRQIKVAALLSGLGDERALNLLSNAVTQPNPLQVAAAHALCLLEDQSGQPVLRSTLWEMGAGMQQRIISAQGIGHCGDKKDVLLLSQKLRGGEKSGMLRQAEAGALLKLCDGDPVVLAERSVSWAEQALTDEDWNVRAQAVAALGDVQNAKSLPLLRKAMHDSRVEVRKLAADSLAKLGGKEAMGALAEGLRDESTQVRAHMMRVIARVGGAVSKDTATQKLMMTALKKESGQGGQGEQVARAAAMAALGDESQTQEVEKMVRSGDAEAQAMAVVMSGEMPQQKESWLARIVADEKAAFATRLRAAVSLAQAGNKAGLALLREAAAKGGAEGVWALSALQKLGEGGKAEGADDPVQTALKSGDPAVRRATVEALGTWQAQKALPYLLQAARDPNLGVRSQVLETAAHLSKGDGGGPVGMQVAKVLSKDRDAALSERALAVLSTLQKTSGKQPVAVENPAAQNTQKQAEKKAEHETQNEVPDAGGVDAASVNSPSREVGFLRFEGPAGTSIQIDKQTPFGMSDKPVEVSAGEHTVSYPGGQQVVNVTAGSTLTVKIAASQLVDLVKAGVEAFSRKDYKKARKLLEKASTLCTRKKEEKAVCHAVGYELAFHLGQTYEAQEAWALSMTEYDKIEQPGFFGKVKSDGHKAVAEAMKRIAPKVGRIRISRMVKGKCQTEDVWMPPGRHRVNVAGGQSVVVRPQETVEVKGCS